MLSHCSPSAALSQPSVLNNFRHACLRRQGETFRFSPTPFHVRSHGETKKYPHGYFLVFAPEVGIEPTTSSLTGKRSTTELLRNGLIISKSYKKEIIVF